MKYSANEGTVFHLISTADMQSFHSFILQQSFLFFFAAAVLSPDTISYNVAHKKSGTERKMAVILKFL